MENKYKGPKTLKELKKRLESIPGNRSYYLEKVEKALDELPNTIVSKKDKKEIYMFLGEFEIEKIWGGNSSHALSAGEKFEKAGNLERALNQYEKTSFDFKDVLRLSKKLNKPVNRDRIINYISGHIDSSYSCKTFKELIKEHKPTLKEKIKIIDYRINSKINLDMFYDSFKRTFSKKKIYFSSNEYDGSCTLWNKIGGFPSSFMFERLNWIIEDSLDKDEKEPIKQLTEKYVKEINLLEKEERKKGEEFLINQYIFSEYMKLAYIYNFTQEYTKQGDVFFKLARNEEIGTRWRYALKQAAVSAYEKTSIDKKQNQQILLNASLEYEDLNTAKEMAEKLNDKKAKEEILHKELKRAEEQGNYKQALTFSEELKDVENIRKYKEIIKALEI